MPATVKSAAIVGIDAVPVDEFVKRLFPRYAIAMTKDEVRRRVAAALPTLPQQRLVRRISLFGSHLHGDAGPQSDVDLLVELTEPVGLFSFVDMKLHLEQVLGKRVDLLTPASLSKYFRDEVLAEAEPVYER